MISQFVIPKPPSVNKAWRNVAGKGRVRTGDYNDWKTEALWRIKLQKVAPVKGHVIVIIGVERESMLADIDNMVKPLLDVLGEKGGAGIIKDDKFVMASAFAWAPMADGLARVAIVPAMDLTLHLRLAAEGGACGGGWFLEEPKE